MTEQLGHRVKQLVWEPCDTYKLTAWSPFGPYNIDECDGWWAFNHDVYGDFFEKMADHELPEEDAIDELKAAAQADCEHRVNSQLEPAPAVSEAGLVEALRQAFPHFQNNERVTPEAISRIGAEWQDMVVNWAPFQTAITFSDQDGTTRHLEWFEGEPDVGCFSGYVMAEDATWEVRALQQESGDE